MNPELAARRKNVCLWVSVVLTTLTWIGLFALLFAPLSGCVNGYELARLRYAHQVADTTFQTITTTIPRDSVVTSFKTDTTHYFETVKQGRATLTIIREPTNTTVIANCDSLTKSQKVPTRIETQEWGTDPKYETQTRILLAVVIGLGMVVAFFVGVVIVVVKLKLISNGTAAQPN